MLTQSLTHYPNLSKFMGPSPWTSLIFGLLISAIGFRALQSIVDIEAWKGITGNQLNAFYLVDILLTSGLIAGGSDGVHKLMQIYSTFMDASNEKRKGAD